MFGGVFLELFSTSAICWRYSKSEQRYTVRYCSTPFGEVRAPTKPAGNCAYNASYRLLFVAQVTCELFKHILLQGANLVRCGVLYSK